jgi:hypothetical protein
MSNRTLTLEYTSSMRMLAPCNKLQTPSVRAPLRKPIVLACACHQHGPFANGLFRSGVARRTCILCVARLLDPLGFVELGDHAFQPSILTSPFERGGRAVAKAHEALLHRLTPDHVAVDVGGSIRAQRGHTRQRLPGPSEHSASVNVVEVVRALPALLQRLPRGDERQGRTVRPALVVPTGLGRCGALGARSAARLPGRVLPGRRLLAVPLLAAHRRRREPWQRRGGGGCRAPACAAWIRAPRRPGVERVGPAQLQRPARCLLCDGHPDAELVSTACCVRWPPQRARHAHTGAELSPPTADANAAPLSSD